MTKISEVQILPIKPTDGLVAFASFVLDNRLYLGSIAIYQKRDGSGYRITFPSKKLGNKSLNIYHPINKQTTQEIEKAVLAKATQVLN
jgi:stage V sporulation protein G